jgi:hypothetical protein
MKILILDVHFISITNLCPPVAALRKNLLGNLYVETNVREIAGQGKAVSVVDGCLRVAGRTFQGGLNFLERREFLLDHLTQ